MKRTVFAQPGLICLGLGTAGIFLPILPTTLFFLLTLFFFANSSERLHTRFVGTKPYRDHLDSYGKKQGMMASTKISIILSVSLLMGSGFFMMARKQIRVPCIILAVVWLYHIVYSVFFVKTIPDRA